MFEFQLHSSRNFNWKDRLEHSLIRYHYTLLGGAQWDVFSKNVQEVLVLKFGSKWIKLI